jgi:hypothetical protein
MPRITSITQGWLIQNGGDHLMDNPLGHPPHGQSSGTVFMASANRYHARTCAVKSYIELK